MGVRFFTTLGILAFIVPALLFGGLLLELLIACIIIFGGMEYLKLSDHDESWPAYLRWLIIATVFGVLFIKDTLQMPFIGICILCFLSIPVFTDRFTIKDAFLSISFLIFFYTIAMAFLTIYAKEPLLIWYIIIATYACDTGAYFSGYFFGKHKLNERISPKKTIEGSIGGWLLGAVLSFLFAYFFIEQLSVPQILFASCLLPFCCQIGDLAFSAMKRCYGIKDFSNLLPGHGGVLDRLDSLIFNLVCFHMILAVVIL